MFGTRKIAKGDAWTGTVSDKSRKMPDGWMYFYLEVAIDGGGTKKFRVGRTLWKSLAAGDRMTKVAGSDAVKG